MSKREKPVRVRIFFPPLEEFILKISAKTWREFQDDPTDYLYSYVDHHSEDWWQYEVLDDE